MTTDRLTEIEQRLAAATEYPWVIWEDLTDGGFVHVGDLAGVIPEGEMATEDGVEVNPTAKCYIREDAELIAHAPADLAALVKFARAVEDAEKNWRRRGHVRFQNDVRFRSEVLAARRALTEALEQP